jgi:hypothetical protein
MSFEIFEDREVIRIIVEDKFKKRYFGRDSIQPYLRVLTLASLRNNIKELSLRLTENQNSGGTIVNVKDRIYSLICYLERVGIKLDKSSCINTEKNDNLTDLETAFGVFQDLFGIIKQLDELKVKKELSKQIKTIKTNLKSCYSGYVVKNDNISIMLATDHNKRRLKSISESLNLLQKLNELNPNNYELMILIVNTNQIYQSLTENNSPTPLCKTLMKEELRQFEAKLTEFQTLLDPTELW